MTIKHKNVVFVRTRVKFPKTKSRVSLTDQSVKLSASSCGNPCSVLKKGGTVGSVINPRISGDHSSCSDGPVQRRAHLSESGRSFHPAAHKYVTMLMFVHLTTLQHSKTHLSFHFHLQMKTLNSCWVFVVTTSGWLASFSNHLPLKGKN